MVRMVRMVRDERVDEIVELLAPDPEALEVLLRIACSLAKAGEEKVPPTAKSDLTT